MPRSDETTFEQDLDRLEALVRELETGGLTLDASFAKYEESVRLARACRARLEVVERRVEELLADGDVRRLRVD